MNPISILLFVFGAVLLLVAWITGSGDTGLIRTIRFVRVKNKKKYAAFLGKSIAAIACTMILAGAAALVVPVGVTAAILVVCVVTELVFIAKNAEKHYR